jgi:hypothetical protein
VLALVLTVATVVDALPGAWHQEPPAPDTGPSDEPSG